MYVCMYDIPEGGRVSAFQESNDAAIYSGALAGVARQR